jgi:hypothetical protein
MYEPPGDGYGTDAPPPFDHDLDHRGYWVDDDAAYGTASADDRVARSGDSGDGQVSSGARLPEADRPPDESRALLDEDAEFQPEEPPLDADYGRYEAVRAGDELLPLDEEAPDDRTRLAFGAHSGYEQPPPEYGPIALDHAPTYRADQIGPEDDPLDHPPTHPRALTGLDEDALYERPELDEGHGPIWLGDGAGPGSALGGSEDAGDSPPLWRTARTRYGLHAAAFAVAIAFVAIAGFGLGLLSDERTAVGPPERDTVSAEAGAEPPSPSAGRSTQPAAPERPAGLSELVTVRVAPAPVAAVPQQPPEARASTSAPPLPPPPKPALRQSPPVQPASTDRLLAGVVDDAAAAQLEAEDAKAGAGGPFQPLFTKLPAMPPPDTRVFVHYSAGAVGAPATAMHLVRHLKAEGFTVEARPVEFAIPTSSVRYFFDADRKEAEALRAALQGQIPGGAAMPVMDFTSYEPKPRPGLIEIWLRA